MSDIDSAHSAMQKLEELFARLPGEEREVVASLVRSSLIGAASRFSGMEVSGYAMEDFVTAINGRNTPQLVSALKLPGALAAHSIPSCAASGLEALRSAEGMGR